MKIIKAFKETPTSPIWINEGVCGVDNDDPGIWYYDVAGSNEIGKGGWSTPNDSSDFNLWYEPTSPNHGPIMYEIIEELYGTWDPQAHPAREALTWDGGFWYQAQIQLGTVSKSGNDFTISYRTEGVKDVGVKVMMFLHKFEGGNWVQKQTSEKTITQKWDNSQDITFTITEDGTYQVTARIAKSDNSTPYAAWEATDIEFTRP